MRRPFPCARRVLSATALLILGAAACSDGTGPQELPVTLSGTLTNRSGAAIPANARVVVLWAGPDEPEAYIFGEGTLDRATNRFTVTFDRPLPSGMTYDGVLGIGLVIVTTDPNLGEGRVPDNYDYPANVIGATEQHAVIYMGGDPDQYAGDWPASFDRGYTVGRGVDLPGTFDGFAPARPNSMVLVIDDLANIDTVNWT